MSDYSTTKARIFQWAGIVLILAVFAGAYWYFQVFAGVKTNTSLTDPLNEGLAGYWKMDDGSGTSATDSSTNANTGTLNGGPTWTTGQIGSAVNFDGTDDYIAVGNNTSTNVTGKITVSAWIYSGTSAAGQDVISKYDGGGLVQYLFLLGTNGTSLNFYSGNGNAENAASGTIPLATWTHVAGIYDGINTKLYINGVFVANAPTPLAPVASGTGLYLGNRVNAPRYFNGKMDEVRIYNRALSSDEVADLYRLASPTGTDTSLKGYWSFNGKDISGTTAYDRSGAGNNGTLTGGPTVTPGKVGQALNFDGVNDNVNMGNVTSLKNSVFTYSAWINPTSLSAERNIFGGGAASTPRFSITTGGILTFLKTGVTTIGVSTGTAPTVGVWTHVAVTYDVSGNYVFYINGVNAGSGTNAQTFDFTSASFGIGSDSGNMFVGKIDEVRIYNRALTEAEITTLYNASK